MESQGKKELSNQGSFRFPLHSKIFGPSATLISVVKINMRVRFRVFNCALKNVGMETFQLCIITEISKRVKVKYSIFIWVLFFFLILNDFRESMHIVMVK